MKQIMDLRGQRFGRLTVTNNPPKRIGRYTMWQCRCECGQQRSVPMSQLRSGNTKSCGCLRRENTAALKRSHGLRHTPEYSLWLNMKQRCTNPKAPEYAHYGGRGITVCDRWMQSFEAFYADMGPKPVDMRGRQRNLYSLDRIDNNGPYSPDNCKWATQSEQRINSRATRKLTLNGRTQTVTEWERERGLPPSMIRQRLNAGWSSERAITTPPEHHFGKHH